MLLPSAFPGGPRPRLQRMDRYDREAAVQTIPLSSPITPYGIGGTCNALQSVLGTQLREGKSPRLRNANPTLYATARILKRPPPPPRSGMLGKRRLLEDGYESEDDESIGIIANHGYGLGLRLDGRSGGRSGGVSDTTEGKVSTPKRRRHVPPSMPFGIESRDLFGLDEGLDLDDSMSEGEETGGADSRAMLVDEGYGSMEFEPGELSAALLKHKTTLTPTTRHRSEVHPTRSHPFLEHPSIPDSDAMSIGTPNSTFAALALSPEAGLPSQVAASPPMLLSPQPIPAAMMSVSPLIRSPSIFLDNSVPHLNDDTYASEPSLPTLSTSSRPSLQRFAALAHSDPHIPTCSSFQTSSNSAPASSSLAQPVAPPRAIHSAVPTQASLPTTPLELFPQPRTPVLAAVPAVTPSPPPPLSAPAVNDRMSSYMPKTVYTWSDADDRALVALVIERLRFKRRDWDECARVLGAHGSNAGASLGRRWRELVSDGCVGLKFRYGAALIVDRERVSGPGADEEGEKVARRLRGVGVGRSSRRDVRAVRWD